MFDERIVGSVERIVYRNQENGYHVLSVLSRETGKECTVTANLLKIHEGVTMEFQGQWVSNPRFGTQFKAEKAIEVAPETKEALVKYLSSSFFKGIGPVIAKKIVGHFGDNTLEVLKTDIDRLAEVPGISKKKIGKIKESWIENSEINEIMVFLQSYNISTLYSVRVYETYGRDCVNKIRENPYKLAKDIKGIGFRYCDKIALDMGFTKDCKERISAGILYILSEGENDGHCYLLYNQLIQKSSELLGVRVQDKIDDVLDELIAESIIKLSNIEEEQRFYSNQIFYDERYCAYKIDVLKNTPGLIHNPSIIEDWEKELLDKDFKLSEEQKDAVLGIVNEKVSVLTGGAGVGKTTVLKSLLDLLGKLKVQYCLAAPTGRASKQIEEATGANASTIHRLLGWNFAEGKFLHNERDELGYEMFIIDESSMIGVTLMSALLRAIPKDSHVLFVGDMNQIPPVNAGNPFKDFINSGFIKSFRLTKIFRQLGDSDIILHSNNIINGIEPELDTPIVNPDMWANNASSMFIDSDFFDYNKNFSDYPDYSTLYYNVDIKEMIRRLYVETIPKYYPNTKDIQIIVPQNVGEVGTIELNKMIQDVVNPPSIEKQEIKVADRVFRTGDKIIIIQNDYDYGIFNGDIGYIKSIDAEEKSCVIDLGGDSKTVEIKKDGILLMRLGYAISIHKAQGAEFEIVIIPFVMNFYNMLYRQLLYTGITRARKLVIFVGHRRALAMAVKNVDQSKRQTSLIELLNQKLTV